MSRTLPRFDEDHRGRDRFLPIAPPPLPRLSTAVAVWRRLCRRRFRFVALGDVQRSPKVYSIRPIALIVVLLVGFAAVSAVSYVAYQGVSHRVELALAQREVAHLAAERARLSEENRRQANALIDLGRQVQQLGTRIQSVEASAETVRRLVGAPAPKRESKTPADSDEEGDVDPIAWVESLIARTGGEGETVAADIRALKPAAEAYNYRQRHTPQGLPVNGRITSPFGVRSNPTREGSENHAGVDVAARWGEPVHATADGRVRYSGWIPGYGNAVEIDHGFGVLTLYGHNSRLAVRVGQNVKRGQVISYAGSTGMSTGPHVHYEIRVKGVPVDPLRFNRSH